MKRVVQTASIVAVVVLILAAGFVWQSGEAQTQEEDEVERTVSVTGSGRVSARPDTAVINVGVGTEAPTAEEALAENNERMQALIDSLRASGVDADNIQTTTINLHARYEEEPRINSDGPRLVGYRAENMVQVRVTDLDALGEILDAAVQAGGNQIHGIHFEVSDAAELQAQARDAAVANAREKAEQLVTAAGAELGEVVTITETEGGPGPLVRMEAAQADVAASVPIEAGTQEIEVRVDVTWRLQ